MKFYLIEFHRNFTVPQIIQEGWHMIYLHWEKRAGVFHRKKWVAAMFQLLLRAEFDSALRAYLDLTTDEQQREDLGKRVLSLPIQDFVASRVKPIAFEQVIGY